MVVRVSVMIAMVVARVWSRDIDVVIDFNSRLPVVWMVIALSRLSCRVRYEYICNYYLHCDQCLPLLEGCEGCLIILLEDSATRGSE